MRRGFAERDYRNRIHALQSEMCEHGFNAMFYTNPPEFYYFTGFLTQFWQSPTRPWFLLIPARSEPIAVIPSIGLALMARGVVRDIRTWSAPNEADDGISLLAQTIENTIGKSARIAAPMGIESRLRMPLDSFRKLDAMLDGVEFVSDQGITRQLRAIKSAAEIAKIEHACQIASCAFDRVGEIATVGVAQSDLHRRFQILCLEEGADAVPYLAGGVGAQGYADVISPAGDHPLAEGDIFMLDTGLVWDGYFCDFDRNFALGSVDDDANETHRQLIAATEIAIALAKPGVTLGTLYDAMATHLGANDDSAGRFGHGLGIDLTEWPSITQNNPLPIEAGMVLTIEPSAGVAGDNLLVHEENIVISTSGARRLSKPANADIPIFGALK